MAEAILPKSPLVANIPNAAYPTAGQGLVLETNGLVNPIALATGTRTGAKFLRDDQTWQAAGGTTYRKNLPKTVNTTVAATDLLNAEITLAAGVLGTTGTARLTASGDWLNNSGGAVAPPRFQVVLGGTTVIDTGAIPVTVAASASRPGWQIACLITNLGAANSQSVSFTFLGDLANGPSASNNPPFTTGSGHMRVFAGFFDFSGWAVNTSALDTSTSKALVLNVINGSASATYETKLFNALVEIV